MERYSSVTMSLGILEKYLEERIKMMAVLRAKESHYSNDFPFLTCWRCSYRSPTLEYEKVITWPDMFALRQFGQPLTDL